MGGCGTGRDEGEVQPGHPVFYRYVARHHVADAARHEKGRNSPRSTVSIFLVVPLDGIDTPDPRAHDDAEPVGFILVDLQSGILEGLGASGDAVMHEFVDFPGILNRHVVGNVEVFDHTAD